MRTRLLLAALLAFGPALHAAAQVVSLPGSAGAAVPTVIPTLNSGLSPSISAPSLANTLATSLTPSLSAPALAPSLAPSLTPIPALVPSAITAAAVPSASPAFAIPAALVPRAAAASHSDERPNTVHSLKDLHRIVGGEDAAGAMFDGSVGAAPLIDGEHAPKPIGAYGVSTVRVRSAAEAGQYIPQTSNTTNFVSELRTKWDKIGWLDLRLYRDSVGNYFRAVDLTGRPDLIDHLPEVQPHEATLVKKIQLHTADLQLVLREEGKTPDLIVAGVVTEMKSLHADGLLTTQLEHADAQLKAHSQRHRLGLGAVAIDVVGPKRDWSHIEEDVNGYAATHTVGFDRVEIHNGDEYRVIVTGKNGGFISQAPGTKAKAIVPSTARMLVPNALLESPQPDPRIVLREITEPSKRLRAAGVKATVTVYGSARILPADIARSQYDALIKKFGKKPKRPEERRLVYAAFQAVEASKYYEIAREFGRIVAEEGGGEVAVVTGGGPGIMEAANRGAFEAGGPSVGYNILLDKEQGLNKYATPGLDFEFENFATRKMALRHGSMGLVYMPGGFGTMDELFEVLTLMQTRKMKKVPIVLVGEKSYWDKILDFDEFVRMGLISPDDLSLFVFADTARDAWRAIAHPPVPVASR